MSKPYSNQTIYSVYTDDDELLFTGTASEIARIFGCKRNSIYCNICRKQKFQNKYWLIRIGRDNEQ